jgi:hypothetical protein
LHSCFWELFFAWILVVFFADGVEPFCLTLRSRQFWSILPRLCRAVSLVLGDRDFSHSSDLFLAFVWLLITCLIFRFFLFLFSLNWLLVCVVNALIKGEIEDRSVRGPVDGHSRLWWVIDNVVWTNSWPSIAGEGCGLICVGAGEEWARKVYALRGLWGVERQVGLTRGTRWPAGSSAGRMVARKARRSRRPESVQGSGSRPESACGVCGGSPENRRVTWLNHKTKTVGSAGGDGIWARWEASMPADLWRDRRACVGRTWSAATAWPCDEEECYMTYLPLRDCITT